MFSARSENILLNYFVVLFTISLFSVYSVLYKDDCSFFMPTVLSISLIASGIFLYFDRFFFFKISFTLILLFSIIWILLLPNFSFVIILILFLSLSQISLLLSYVFLCFFLVVQFEAVEMYLIFSIFMLSLIFTFILGFKKIQKDLYSKVLKVEGKYSLLRHDIANLCTILLFKNQDASLAPVLEKMRINLEPKISTSPSSKSSVGGLLRMAISSLSYDYNLRLKKNFYLTGENILLLCFFSHLLDNYVRRGSTVVVEENCIVFKLSNCKRDRLVRFLKKRYLYSNCELDEKFLKLHYET